ncbi:MAG: hypothetical protein HY903_19600 [Deltaproteobacteria bacterium]|nr:hypothetical protein [Deltaproteobacteria bacterium]
MGNVTNKTEHAGVLTPRDVGARSPASGVPAPAAPPSAATPAYEVKDGVDHEPRSTTDASPRAESSSLAEPSAAGAMAASDPIQRRRATYQAEARELLQREEERAAGQVVVAAAAQDLVATTSAALGRAEPTLDPGTALAKVEAALLQLDAEIADAARREATLAPALALSEADVTGDPAKARLRAEALLALGASVTVKLGDQATDAGNLRDRLAALQDARTSVVMLRASLTVGVRPTTANAVITAPLKQELARLTSMLEEVERALARAPADAPPQLLAHQRRQLQSLVADLRAQIAQVEHRWQPLASSLNKVAKSVGVKAAPGADYRDVAATLKAVEGALGIDAKPLSPGHKGMAELQERLGRVMVARRQGAALIAVWLQEDLGVSTAALVHSGLLTKAPNDLTAAELEALGLKDAKPGELSRRDQQVALVGLVSDDPAHARAALERLGAAYGAGKRDLARDMTEIITAARTGRLATAADTFTALRARHVDGFYDKAALANDALALYGAMKGVGTTDEVIWRILEPLTPAMRQALVEEFARLVKSRGEKNDDANALFQWLADDQSGWKLGKSTHLLTRERLPKDWAKKLAAGPMTYTEGGNPRFKLKSGQAIDLRRPEGQLAWTKEYYAIFAAPHDAAKMGDVKGVLGWRAADHEAKQALAVYEAAVKGGDAARIEAGRREFCAKAGEAVALHQALTAAYGQELETHIERLEQTAHYTKVGAVIAVTTVATIATAGALAAPAIAASGAAIATTGSMVTAAAGGILVGTAAGTATGAVLRVAESASQQGLSLWQLHKLDDASWKAVGAGAVEDLKLAAGTAVASAIPTAGFGRLGYLATAASRGASLSRVQQAAVAFQTLPRVVSMAGAGAVLNAGGAMGMRVVQEGMNLSVDGLRGQDTTPAWLRATLAQVDTSRQVDMELSGQNLAVELASGAVSGTLNRYLGFLSGVAPAAKGARPAVAAALGQALKKSGRLSVGFTVDMSVNLSDQSARNLVYGRDWNTGLTDALILGAPGQVAGGVAARRLAAQSAPAAPTRKGQGAEVPTSTVPPKVGDLSETPRAAQPMDVSEAVLGQSTKGAQRLTPAAAKALGENGGRWFAGLAPLDQRAAVVLFDAGAGTLPPFGESHYNAMVALLRNGVPEAAVVKLTPAVASDLHANLGDLFKKPLLVSKDERATAPRALTESATQKTWDALVAKIGDDATAQAIAKALRPALSTQNDWMPIVSRLRETEAGKRLLTEHQRSRFAKAAHFELERRLGDSSGEPDGATLQRWYEGYWQRASERYNDGLGKRYGLKLEGAAPGLERGPIQSVADLRQRLKDNIFSVYTGIADPFRSRAGYAGVSHRSALGTQDIHLLPRLGGKRSIADRVDAQIATLLHELDHVKRGFSYRREGTAEAVAYNLLGEALAPLHEMSVFEPRALRAIVGTADDLYLWLHQRLTTYQNPEVVGPRYFTVADGQAGDPIQLVVAKIFEVANSGPSKDPVANLTRVLQDPGGTGMLGRLDSRAPRAAVNQALDFGRQESLRKVALTDSDLEVAVKKLGWDQTTADRVLELIRRGQVDTVLARGLHAGEVDLLWKALVRGESSPTSEHAASLYDRRLTAEQVQILARRPSLLTGDSIEGLRLLSAAHLRALLAVPEVLEHVSATTLHDYEPQQIAGLAVRLKVAKTLTGAGMPAAVVEYLKPGDGLSRLQYVHDLAVRGALAPTDPVLQGLLQDLPKSVREGTSRAPGLTDWLRARGVEPQSPNRSLSEIVVDPDKVPAGLTQNEAERLRMVQMLAAEGFDAPVLGSLEGGTLVRLWVAHFGEQDSYASAYGAVVDAVQHAHGSKARSVPATEAVGAKILQRHLQRSLERRGLSAALVQGLDAKQVAIAANLFDAATAFGTASLDFALVEDSLRSTLPHQTVDHIVRAVVARDTRQALVAAGAEPAMVSKLSADELAAVARLQRLGVLDAPAAARARQLQAISGAAGDRQLAKVLDGLGREPSIGSVRPGLYQMREDLIALGASPESVRDMSGPALVRLHYARLRHWDSAASANMEIGEAKHAGRSTDAIDAAVIGLRKLQDFEVAPEASPRPGAAEAVVAALGASMSPKALFDAATAAFPSGKAPVDLDLAALAARFQLLPEHMRPLMVTTLSKFVTPAQTESLRALLLVSATDKP